jgi:integrase
VAEITIGGKRTRQHRPSEKLAKAALTRLRQGSPLASGKASLGAWLTRWVEELARGKRVEAKTAQTYAAIVRNQWLKQPVSRSPIGSIEVEDVETALGDLLDRGLSRTTVSHGRAVLSAAYNAAIRAKLVAANPVVLARVPGRPATPRIRTLTMSRAVYNQIGDAVADTDIRAYVELIARTGLRPGEALALKWSDVPIKDQMIHVRRALKEVGSQWLVGPTKTALSSRDVPFTHELVPILFKYRRSHGKPSAEDWVFPSPFDPAKPDNPVRLAKIARHIFDAAGLNGWTPRDLRALHATMLLSEGVEVTVVSRRLGHSDPTTTYRHYAGVVTAADREAAQETLWDSPRRPKPAVAHRGGDEAKALNALPG